VPLSRWCAAVLHHEKKRLAALGVGGRRDASPPKRWAEDTTAASGQRQSGLIFSKKNQQYLSMNHKNTAAIAPYSSHMV
jgi:hypothetical protein